MKIWDDILNTAIIGTDKKQVNTGLAPEQLVQTLQLTEKVSNEKEEQFLAAASVVYNYKRAGILPLDVRTSLIPVCEEEEKRYCGPDAAGSLQAVLGEENDSLLYWWLFQCSKKELIVKPEYIPALFEIAEKNKELRTLIVACSGKRGQWLRQFNSNWTFAADATYQDTFEHGRSEERKNALITWRRADPTAARDALQKVWKQEQAAAKAELLSALEENISKDDEAFLQEAWKEKSQKVKEEALNLLKQIPDSFLVKEVWEFVRPLLTLKKSGGVLGLMSKESIEVNLSFTIPEHFKTYGISHIDANKIYTEKEFTLDQLIGFVPPTCWEQHFDLKSLQILQILDKREETQKFISSFARGANTFKNVEWAQLLFKDYKKLCTSVVKDFSKELREEAAIEAFKDFKSLRSILPSMEEEWPASFVMNLLKRTAQEPYTHTKNAYRPIIHHFPVSIADQLDKIEVTDAYRRSYWEGIAADIQLMLSIKKQINQSF
jgi:hypothetical protein